MGFNVSYLGWLGLDSRKWTRQSNRPVQEARRSDFEAVIPQGVPRRSGRVELAHGATYSIRLSNASPRRCDARVEIDGHLVGVWRVPPRSVIEVERPVNDTGRFTFYRLDSLEARQLGLQDHEALGLITVMFFPELCPAPAVRGIDPDVRPSVRRGGTGLSGFSGQAFVAVEPIQHDLVSACVTHLRLTAQDATIRPLRCLSGVPPVRS